MPRLFALRSIRMHFDIAQTEQLTSSLDEVRPIWTLTTISHTQILRAFGTVGQLLLIAFPTLNHSTPAYLRTGSVRKKSFSFDPKNCINFIAALDAWQSIA